MIFLSWFYYISVTLISVTIGPCMSRAFVLIDLQRPFFSIFLPFDLYNVLCLFSEK